MAVSQRGTGPGVRVIRSTCCAASTVAAVATKGSTVPIRGSKQGGATLAGVMTGGGAAGFADVVVAAAITEADRFDAVEMGTAYDLPIVSNADGAAVATAAFVITAYNTCLIDVLAMLTGGNGSGTGGITTMATGAVCLQAAAPGGTVGGVAYGGAAGLDSIIRDVAAAVTEADIF